MHRRAMIGTALATALLAALMAGSAWAQQVTGTIDAQDQQSDGTTVTVSQASISGANGWVAIHQMNGDQPGPVIGQTFLQEGSGSNIAVTLNQPVTSGTMLMAMLHVDDPADQQYTFPQDNSTDGPVMANGQVVAKTFTVTVGGGGANLPGTGGIAPLLAVVGGALISVGVAAGYLARRRTA